MRLSTLPRDWDVVVAGAGVAGAVVAYRLARRGLRVLLAEKAVWPRDKACGGCLNAATLRALDQAGLGAVHQLGQPFTQLALASGRRRASLPLPVGRAVSRRRLDDWLVRQAVQAGAELLTSTQVVLCPVDQGMSRDSTQPGRRHVLLRQSQAQCTVSTRLVIGGDGLGSRLLREESSDELQVADDSRIGIGTTLDEAPDFYRAGRIHMACAAPGYVGLVRVESHRLNIGAALDPAWIKQCGGPAAAVKDVLSQTGFPCWDGLDEADWHGTPRLTRQRSQLGSERVLVLGDAAGYVEPFTGEGMGWAVASAAALEPLALEAVTAWRPGLVERWNARHARVVQSRQHGCHGIAALLRRPRLLQAAMPVLDTVPSSVRPLTAWLNRDYLCDRPEVR